MYNHWLLLVVAALLAAVVLLHHIPRHFYNENHVAAAELLHKANCLKIYQMVYQSNALFRYINLEQYLCLKNQLKIYYKECFFKIKIILYLFLGTFFYSIFHQGDGEERKSEKRKRNDYVSSFFMKKLENILPKKGFGAHNKKLTGISPTFYCVSPFFFFVTHLLIGIDGKPFLSYVKNINTLLYLDLVLLCKKKRDHLYH
jgi:hypothetical protein